MPIFFKRIYDVIGKSSNVMKTKGEDIYTAIKKNRDMVRRINSFYINTHTGDNIILNSYKGYPKRARVNGANAPPCPELVEKYKKNNLDTSKCNSAEVVYNEELQNNKFQSVIEMQQQRGGGFDKIEKQYIVNEDSDPEHYYEQLRNGVIIPLYLDPISIASQTLLLCDNYEYCRFDNYMKSEKGQKEIEREKNYLTWLRNNKGKFSKWAFWKNKKPTLNFEGRDLEVWNNCLKYIMEHYAREIENPDEKEKRLNDEKSAVAKATAANEASNYSSMDL